MTVTNHTDAARPQPPRETWGHTFVTRWGPVLCLALVTWLAYYSYFRQLGLYEDDYYFIGKPLDYNWAELGTTLREFWGYWPQGRPIGFSLPYLLGFIGSHTVGLPGVYMLAALIVALNAVLAHFVFRRLGLGAAAFIGALAFTLFPADTTHGYLMHATGLQPSLTFLLLATLAYLTEHRVLAYVLITGSLLTYESAFPVFLAVPLLVRPWRPRLLRTLVLHGAVMAGILLVDIAVRRWMLDNRLDQIVSPAEMLYRIGLSLFIGPWVSGKLWAIAPVRVLRGLNVEMIAASVLVGGLCAAWLLRAARRRPDQPPLASLGQLLLAGAVMWMLAYSLAFTHFPPYNTLGRFTSVHLAAAFGASVTIAALAAGVLAIVRRDWLSNVFLAGCTAYFGVLAGYGVLIQQDFALSWRYQREFWQAVLPLIPDVEPGTVVIVDRSGLPDSRFIISHDWEANILLGLFYEFPESWDAADYPQVFVEPPGWQAGVQLVGGRLEWLPARSVYTSPQPLPDGQTILLEWEDGQLVRRTGTLSLQGHSLRLKPEPAAAAATWPTGELYRLLMEP
ncbi:MAG: hypothetical protein IT317_19740 [Anaerolineales bacterium]|nr:hypothetical protein [Anaerolineales bacterium]